MTICFPCGNCGQKYEVGGGLAGKRFYCRVCRAPVQVPVPYRLKGPVASTKTRAERSKPAASRVKEPDPFAGLLDDAGAVDPARERAAVANPGFAQANTRRGIQRSRAHPAAKTPSLAALAAVTSAIIAMIVVFGAIAWVYRTSDWATSADSPAIEAESRPTGGTDSTTNEPKLAKTKPNPSADSSRSTGTNNGSASRENSSPSSSETSSYGPNASSGGRYPGASSGYPGADGEPLGARKSEPSLGYGPSEGYSGGYPGANGGYPGAAGGSSKDPPPGYGPSKNGSDGGFPGRESGYPGDTTGYPGMRPPGMGAPR